jgi:hypothetical protein
MTGTLGCLVDWETKDGLVVPWMTFPTIEKAIAMRKNSHGSWPHLVATIEAEPVTRMPSRRAQASKRGEPYFSETVDVYRLIGKPRPYYD